MQNIHWTIPWLIQILIGPIFLKWLGKRISMQPARTKRMWLQYTFAAMFALVFAVVVGHMNLTLWIFTFIGLIWWLMSMRELHFVSSRRANIILTALTLLSTLALLGSAVERDHKLEVMTCMIVGVGFLNGFANYASWKATAISLSKTSLFTFWDDVIAMSLFYFFTKVTKFINIYTGLGVLLALLMTLLLAQHAYRKNEPLKLWKYIGFYSVLWGVAQFFEGYSATNELPAGLFFASWYIGSFIASCTILFFYKDPDISQKIEVALGGRDVGIMAGNALGNGVCLGLWYWMNSLAPPFFIQSVLLVQEAIIPAIVGLIIFKEHKTFDRVQWYYSAIGIVAIVLIAFGLK